MKKSSAFVLVLVLVLLSLVGSYFLVSGKHITGLDFLALMYFSFGGLGVGLLAVGRMKDPDELRAQTDSHKERVLSS